jgi:polysaccharide biosynthesis protein PslH
MRLLFLCQVLPYPLDAGPKTRVYHVLQYLVERHDVTLIAFTRESDTPEAIAHVRSLCPKCHLVSMRRSRLTDGMALIRSVLTAKPFTILRDEHAEMMATVSTIIQSNSFAAIHADQLSMAQYALHAKRELAAKYPDIHPLMVIDAHNAYYLIPERLARVATQITARVFWKREAQLMACYEATTYTQFNRVLTVTVEDQNAIRLLLNQSSSKPAFMNIPICVDARDGPLQFNSNPVGLLLLGGLHWPPNADAARWFLNDIWPLVKQRTPQAQLFVIGQRASVDIRAHGDFAGITLPQQADNAPVVVTGYVDDPLPFIKSCAALLVPLRSGGGMRVKIVDALNWGLPIISTTIGCEGINITPGHDILVADSPADFAQAVVTTIQSPRLRSELAHNGRELIERIYDWRVVYKAFDNVYG